MSPTPMLSIHSGTGFGTYTVATTIDAEAEGGQVARVTRSTLPQWGGPVGRAILRAHLAAMREVWRDRAHTWACGRQDQFAEHLDRVEREIRDTGYTGPLA